LVYILAWLPAVFQISVECKGLYYVQIGNYFY
jgi:hypothetical protein